MFRVETPRELANWSRSLVQGAHDAATLIKEINCGKSFITSNWCYRLWPLTTALALVPFYVKNMATLIHKCAARLWFSKTWWPLVTLFCLWTPRKSDLCTKLRCHPKFVMFSTSWLPLQLFQEHNLSIINCLYLKANFCLQLSCASSILHDFRPSTRAQFSLTTSTMCDTNVWV